MDRIANNILTYISTKTLRQTSLGTTTSSTSGLGSVDPGGESIEEILASIVPDAIALDRSRRTKPVHIETIVEFGTSQIDSLGLWLPAIVLIQRQRCCPTVERPSLRNCRSPSQSHILPSILASLIDNALRAIPDATEGHVRIVVADRTRLLVPIEEMNAVQPLSPTVNVAFIIEDSGVGMSPEFLATGYFRPMQKQASRPGSWVSLSFDRGPHQLNVVSRPFNRTSLHWDQDCRSISHRKSFSQSKG